MLQPLLRPPAVAANDRLHGAAPLVLPAPPVLDLDFVGRPGLRYPGLPPISFARASTATRINASSLIETVAADTPRFDHHPLTGARLGLLIEEARTNLLTWSEAFDNVAWSLQRATISIDAAVAPDGNATADKLVESSETGQHLAANMATLTNGQTYTASIFAKAAERSRITLQWANGTAFSFRWATFDLLSGTVVTSSGGGISESIQSFGNGWYRCAITDTASATDTDGLGVNLNDGSGFSYAGDGASGVYIWGAVLEAGAFPTSYIPTAGATATRAADLASLGSLSPWYYADEGTMYGEFDAMRSSARLFEIIDNGNNENVIAMRANPGLGIFNHIIRRNNAFEYQNNSVSYIAGSVAKAAMAFRANDAISAFDGTIGAVDTSVTLPTVNRLLLGQNQTTGGEQPCGHIRRFCYWPKRLPNSVLQALSR